MDKVHIPGCFNFKETIQIRERNHNSVSVRISDGRAVTSQVLRSSNAGEVKYLACLSGLVWEGRYEGKE